MDPRKQEFATISKDLILHCKADEFGNLKVPGDGYATDYMIDFDSYVPQRITDDIIKARQAVIKLTTDCIKYEIELYNDDEKFKCTHKDPACDAVYHGLLMQALKKMKFYADDMESKPIHDFHTEFSRLKFPECLILKNGATGGCCTNPVQYASCMPYAANAHDCGNCHRCSSCTNRFRPSQPGLNHTECSPLGKLLQRVNDIVDGISGLEYSRYVGGKAQTTVPENDSNLWDCLHYT